MLKHRYGVQAGMRQVGPPSFCAAKRKYRRGVSRSTEQRILHPRIRDLSADQPPRARDGIGNLSYNDTT